MKKKSPPYAIIVAALLGLVAIFAAYKWKQNQDASSSAAMAAMQKQMQDEIDALKANQNAPTAPPPQANMRNVYYATQPVEAGAKISEAFYEKKPTPVDILPDAFSDGSDIVGFYAIRNIEKGDPLTPRNIGKTLPFLSQRITPGMRAISLQVFNAQYNDTGGFVVDGDKVDLLYTITPTLKSTGEKVEINTQLVMQNLDVLYVPGPKYESEKMNGIGPTPPPGDPISITFEVTPEQAEALVFLAQAKDTQFSMILRSRRDTSELQKIKPFDARDYDFLNLKKLQKTVDKSKDRVDELTKEIEAAEKKQASQGTTNETTNPTPPTP